MPRPARVTEMQSSDRIFVAGHRGLAGSAITRRLRAEGFSNLLLRTHDELDLTNQAAVDAFFIEAKPAYVFLCAARVGGIHANSSQPAQFIRDNLAIQCNVIHAAWRTSVRKLLFLGSSCIYPRHCPQPMKEEHLLTGPLEPTNEPYAIAKIAGLKMCEAYHRQYGFQTVTAMPTNLYGTGDNYHPENSHVLPALIRRFCEAKANGEPTVKVWGSGLPMREFMHADDLASACLFLMKHRTDPRPINVGTGQEVSIAELARMIAEHCGYKGTISFDSSRPDGTPRKLLDSDQIRGMGWTPTIELAQGIARTVDEFRSSLA